MTVGAILSRTANYFFRKLNFDYPFWSTYEHANWDDVDAALVAIGASKGITGAWTNSLAVVAGNKYADLNTGDAYICLVSHTTPSSGTFADERAAQPTYWLLDTISNNAITLAKIQDIATQSLLGRFTAGTGDPEVVSILTARQNLGILPRGQCRLNYISTALIRLDPLDGNLLMIGDVPCKIPSAGVGLAPTGLSANTDYYIFAVDANADGVVDTLEAALVSGGLATDTTTGVKTKSGDRSRTLVGVTRVVAGPLWDSKFVRSYHNRVGAFSTTVPSVNRTFTAPAPTAVLIHATLRAECVAFTDDRCIAYISYPMSNSGANDTFLAPAVDGTLLSPPDYAIVNSTVPQTITKSVPFTVATDGYHYVDVFGYVAAGTGTLNKNAAGAYGRTTVYVG